MNLLRSDNIFECKKALTNHIKISNQYCTTRHITAEKKHCSIKGCYYSIEPQQRSGVFFKT